MDSQDNNRVKPAPRNKHVKDQHRSRTQYQQPFYQQQQPYYQQQQQPFYQQPYYQQQQQRPLFGDLFGNPSTYFQNPMYVPPSLQQAPIQRIVPQFAQQQQIPSPYAPAHYFQPQQQQQKKQRRCVLCDKSNAVFNRKYCQPCAESRTQCRNEDCEETCGPGYLYCFHCNIDCSQCGSKMSMTNDCAQCKAAIAEILAQDSNDS